MNFTASKDTQWNYIIKTQPDAVTLTSSKNINVALKFLPYSQNKLSFILCFLQQDNRKSGNKHRLQTENNSLGEKVLNSKATMTTFMESHFLMVLNVGHVLFVQLALARGSLWSLPLPVFYESPYVY